MESDGAHDWDANPAVPCLSDPDAGSASGTGSFYIGAFFYASLYANLTQNHIILYGKI